MLDNFLITAGEDSVIKVWNLEGQFIKQVELNHGACIWALDCDESQNIIATGGGDGSITIFPLKQSITKRVVDIPHGEVIKKAVLLKDNNFVTVSEKGTLYFYDLNASEWKTISSHADLRSYALLEVSNCRNLIGLAGIV